MPTDAHSLDFNQGAPSPVGAQALSAPPIPGGAPPLPSPGPDVNAAPAPSPAAPEASPNPTPGQGSFTVSSQAQRESLMAGLKAGKIPDDIKPLVAMGIKQWDQQGKAQLDARNAARQAMSPLERYADMVGTQSDAELGATRMLGDVAPEAGLRSLEGTGQAGLNMLNFVTDGKSLRPRLLGGFDYNPGSDSHVSAFNAGVQARRQEWANDMSTKYGLDAPMLVTASDVGASFLQSPLVFAKGGAVLKTLDRTSMLPHLLARGEPGMLVDDAVRGGAMMAGQFDPQALSLLDKGGAITAGALIPVALKTAGFGYDVTKGILTAGNSPGNLSMSMALRNSLARTIIRRGDPESVRGEQQAKDFFNSTGTTPVNAVPLTMGQLSGDGRIVAYENRAQDVMTRDFVKNQTNDLYAGVMSLRAQLSAKAGSAGMSVGATADGVYKAIDEADTALRFQAQRDWTAGHANVQAVTAVAEKAQGGTPVMFKFTNLAQTLNDQIANLDNPAAMADPAIRPRLLPLADALAAAQRNGGQLSVQGAMKVLEGLNAGRSYESQAARGAESGVDRAVAEIRNKLLEAVQTDLNTQGTPASKPVVDAIQLMRQNYAQTAQARRDLQNDAVSQIFGSPDRMTDPRAALDTFNNLSPSAQAYGVKLLQQRAPQVLYGMQQRVLEQAIDAATNTTQAAAKGQFNVEAFNNALYGQGAVKSGVLTPDTLKQITDAKGYIASILNNAPAARGGAGTQVWPEDIAINIISRSPEFMARAVSRIMYGLNAEKLFVTKAGQNALRTVANLKDASPQAGTAAALYLGSLMEDDARQQSKAQASAASAARQDQMQQRGGDLR